MDEPDWKALLSDLHRLAVEIQAKASARYQRDRWDPLRSAIVIGLLVKAVSTTRAIRLLLDAQLSNEAHILLRPLLDTMVNLRVLRRDSDGMLAYRLYYFGLKKLRPKAEKVSWLRRLVHTNLGPKLRNEAEERFGKDTWKKICEADTWIPSSRNPNALIKTGDVLEEIGQADAHGTLYNLTSYGLHAFDPLEYIAIQETDGAVDLKLIQGKWADVAESLVVQLLLDCLASICVIFQTGHGPQLQAVADIINDYNEYLKAVHGLKT